MDFRWIEWNEEHATKHGVSVAEAEMLVRAAKRPYPKKHEDGKWLVRARGRGGRFVQVIFLIDDDGTVFVIHARPLTEKEKRAFRK